MPHTQDLAGGIPKFKSIAILVGFSCPLRCSHCSARTNIKRSSLTEKELLLLRSTVTGMSPEEILFSGGEPMLYVDTINRIVSAHPRPKNLDVRITTSGYFATSVNRAAQRLSGIHNLKFVQMSYDRFHQKFVPIQNIKNLYMACRESGIDFSVLMAMQSPLDLSLAMKIKEAGDFKIGTIKITEAGEAKKNGIAFEYPTFDKKVWSGHCPNRAKIAYICGKGFSLCCSYHGFESNWCNFVHPTVRAHLSSPFHSIISKRTFGGIKKYFRLSKLKLEPKHTHECTLCGYLFDEAIKLGRFSGRQTHTPK